MTSVLVKLLAYVLARNPELIGIDLTTREKRMLCSLDLRRRLNGSPHLNLPTSVLSAGPDDKSFSRFAKPERELDR